jgi:hypothetical protein
MYRGQPSGPPGLRTPQLEGEEAQHSQDEDRKNVSGNHQHKSDPKLLVNS